MHWSMSGNTMLDLHISEMPGKIHKKAHRSTSEAIVLMLSGEGYSLVWPAGSYDRRERINWHEGTFFVPPIYWYRQFFNPGLQPERNLAISLEKECLTSPGEIPIRFVTHVEEMIGDIVARVAMRGYGATRGRVDPTRREHDVPRTTQTPHEIPIGVPVASRTSSCQILPTGRSC